MKKTSKNSLKIFFNLFFISVGCFILGCAYNLFYAPFDIMLGGFGGLSMLISTWIESLYGFTINVSIIYFTLNIVIYIFAVKKLGYKFALYTILGITAYTLSLDLTTFVSSITVPNDLLLCCLYGGVLSGLGLGITLRAGASTGGSDLVGSIINHLNSRITIGYTCTAINFIVIVLGAFTYGLELSLYSMISVYITGLITDVIVEGPKSVKAFYVISDEYIKIGNKIMQDLGRGVTKIYAQGMYTRDEKKILLCIVYKQQVPLLKKMIYEIDKNAFVFSVNVNDAMGKGFTALKPNQTFMPKLKASKKQSDIKLKTSQNKDEKK